MKKLVLIFATALTAIWCQPYAAKAQVPVPASTPDNPVTSGSMTDSRNVNCDMVYHTNGWGQLRAIAYDDYNTNTSYLYLADYVGNTATIAIPGAVDIDVVLGDDLSNLGNDYIALVVYNSGTTPMIEKFTITGTGFGPLSATSGGPMPLPVVTGGASYHPPHIDMYPDPGMTINGIPALHQFAVTWGEYVPFTGFDAYLVSGDNSSMSLGTPYTVATNTGYWPDVACLWDYSTGSAFAYVAHITGTDIDLWEADLSTTGGTIIASGINAGMPINKSVRIEAMNQYDPGSGFQKYQLAYAAYAGSAVMDMISYNNLTGNTNLSAAGIGLSGGQNIHPAVSAGPGQIFSGGYGSENHSICWYNDATPFYYSQAIEAATGNVNGTYPDYYEVNQNPTPFIVLDAYYAPIAVSASSNLGKDELLTAWTNNFDIFYKYQGNILQYKPTSVQTVTTANYHLYPNPAASAITIEGANNASYTITDVTGRTLLRGNLANANSTISIESLAKGMYVASITENGKTKELKFVKL